MGTPFLSTIDKGYLRILRRIRPAPNRPTPSRMKLTESPKVKGVGVANACPANAVTAMSVANARLNLIIFAP